MIEQLQRMFADNRFEFSEHAVDASIVRHILLQEMREAVETGEVIEDYPQDKYGPSCLVYGTTQAGRPIHVHCSYPTRDPVKVITVYEPAPSVWVGFRIRRDTDEM